MTRILAHGTAIVVGDTGVIFTGPAGSGKSSLALQTMFSARTAGHFAALLGDDQVFLEAIDGDVTGFCPPSISGMIELRGSGIGRVDFVTEARLHYAIRLIEVHADNRIPEENQRWKADQGIELPLITLDRRVRDPFVWLTALLPGFPRNIPR